MAHPRVVINKRALEELKHTPGVRADLDKRAQRVADRAKSTAPVLTGAYRDSIHVQMEQGEARIISDTDHSIYVEANTGNLARALDAAAG